MSFVRTGETGKSRTTGTVAAPALGWVPGTPAAPLPGTAGSCSASEVFQLVSQSVSLKQKERTLILIPERTTPSWLQRIICKKAPSVLSSVVFSSKGRWDPRNNT